jgi:hypothetical protein
LQIASSPLTPAHSVDSGFESGASTPVEPVHDGGEHLQSHNNRGGINQQHPTVTGIGGRMLLRRRGGGHGAASSSIVVAGAIGYGESGGSYSIWVVLSS